MSWNTCLFCYAQERGGTFFGLQQETNFGLQQEPYEGSLLLEDPKGQILISTKVTYSGRYGTNRDISVAVRAALERPYTLRVKKQSALQEGVNTVLDGLDLGARILGKKTDLSPDYGAPELADDRGIKTNEPEFTRWVLQSRELRAVLDANPSFWFQVGPTGPEGLDHLVEARVPLDWHIDIQEEPLDRYGRPLKWERQKAYYRNSSFPKQLDALVELARAARDAVTAWPMPMKRRNGAAVPVLAPHTVSRETITVRTPFRAAPRPAYPEQAWPFRPLHKRIPKRPAGAAEEKEESPMKGREKRIFSGTNSRPAAGRRGGGAE